MKSEDTPFEGGPLDGRALPVLLGLTGHPPKTYRVPVPDPAGGRPTVLVYRREPRAPGRPFTLTRRWKYVYDPAGGTRHGGGPRWPWSRPSGSDAGPDTRPDATPGSGPEGTDG